MVTKKCQKNVNIYVCEKCAFRCSKKSNWTQHLLTRKHKNTEMVTKKCQKNALPFMCSCGNTYRYKSGLCRHKQKCTHLEELSDINSELLCPDKHLDHMQIYENLDKCVKENEEMRKIMIEQSKQIQEQQTENQELQKQLIEAVKVSGPHIENQTNINNNNQKFNLNFFLNEQCKDAINMSDFIENMELDIEDLTETGRLGYVGGISRILINKLQELDIYKRPLHCTDMKRETLYIKENDEWEKEDNSKKRMTSLINKVANKNCRNLNTWTEKHPEYQVFDSLDNMEYMRLTQIVLGGLGEQECNQFKDKIIRGVIKEVMVNK